MSTDSAAVLPATASPADEAVVAQKLRAERLRRLRILRYAFGVTGAVAIAFAVNWPLSFLTPVFVAVFLALPLPTMTIRQGLNGLLYVVAAFFLGLSFTLFLLPFPLVYVFLLGLTLFHIYYLANRRGPVLLVLFSLMAVLILPMLGITHDVFPTVFALYFAFSAALAVLFVWLAHGLFPDPAAGKAGRGRTARFQPGYSRPAAITAFKSTVAILPIAVLFISANWSSQLLIMIFAAIFSLSPGLAQGTAAALKSLKSTLIGGVAALGFFYLLIAVPELYFFIILMLLTTLWFGAGIFSDHPNAQYLSSAVTTIIVLLGSSMGEDASITDTFVTRVLLISASALYIVGIFSVLDGIFSRK